MAGDIFRNQIKQTKLLLPWLAACSFSSNGTATGLGDDPGTTFVSPSPSTPINPTPGSAGRPTTVVVGGVAGAAGLAAAGTGGTVAEGGQGGMSNHVTCPPVGISPTDAWLIGTRCFFVLTAPLPHVDANLECQKLGSSSHLATFPSDVQATQSPEYSAVVEKLRGRSPIINRFWFGYECTASGTDLLAACPRTAWRWINDEPFGFSAWYFNQPNAEGRCGSMLRLGTDPFALYEWTDRDCGELNPALCVIDP